MGLIFDSSIAIAAERRGDTVQTLLQRIIDTAGDQDAALSTVSVVELVHGIYRADTGNQPGPRGDIKGSAPCWFVREVEKGLAQITGAKR